jgi:hypothetical protein
MHVKMHGPFRALKVQRAYRFYHKTWARRETCTGPFPNTDRNGGLAAEVECAEYAIEFFP